MDLNLQNNVVVITGGASGIGRAVANAFAAEGSQVALWDLAKNVEKAADEIQQNSSVSAVGISVDVTDEEAVHAAVESTQTQLGPIKHLVHCAAIGSGHFGFPFTNLKPSDWRKTLDVNIMGTVNVTHALAPRMRERRSGTMVFISSVAGQIGSQTDPPYSASKAATINFAQCVAKDLAEFGARPEHLRQPRS